jgi:hypothetical protein
LPQKGTEEELPQKGTEDTENRKRVFLRIIFLLSCLFVAKKNAGAEVTTE